MQIVAPETLVAVENGGKQRIIVLANNQAAFMCRWLITYKYRGSQQFSRVEYSNQIY